MSIGAATNWYVRAGGAETNGCGFDSTLSGAGTNYADQDAAQVVFSAGNANRLNTSGAGVTTVTSDGTPFTSQMVGNCIRISGGTNFQTGYYFIITFNSSSSVVFDRTPTSGAAGSAGVGSLGGAAATLVNFVISSSVLPTPVLTAPSIAGNTINVRGSGSDDPGSADYTHTGGFWTFTAGDGAGGRVQFKGYNGRPRIDCDGLFSWTSTLHRWTNFKFVLASATNGNFGVLADSNVGCVLDNCYFDCAGFDVVGCSVFSVINCKFVNSGSSAAGTAGFAAIILTQFGGVAEGNYINGWRSSGIVQNGSIAAIKNNIVVNCKKHGVYNLGNGFGSTITNNTIHGNTLDGIYNSDASAIYESTQRNNIITGNGGYGINNNTSSTGLGDRFIAGKFDYNNFGTGATANTSGAINNGSLGTHDLQLDPQFTNTATFDFSVGTNMKAVGSPAIFPGATSTSYQDIGAVQRIEPSGGGPVGQQCGM